MVSNVFYPSSQVRTTENGIEARLHKAMQQAQFDDMCPDCRNSLSRNSTLSGRSRQGYERIYWRDKEGLEKRAPSNDSLIQRRQSDRLRTRAGSGSDMSHFYEYIGDSPYDTGTYSGRRSNHSIVFLPRNTSSSFKDQHYNDSRCSEEERTLMLSRAYPKDYNPYKSSYTRDERPHYGGSLKEEYYCSDSGVLTDREISHVIPDGRGHFTCPKRPGVQDNHAVKDQIKGYHYTYNPNYDEETTTSRNDFGDVSSSPCTPSECIDFDDVNVPRDQCDTSSSPISIRLKVKGSVTSTPSLKSNRNSESTSLSDNNASLTNLHCVPRTNGTFYKTNRSK